MGKHLITGSSCGFSSLLKIIEEAYAVRLSVVAVVRMPFANLRIPSYPAVQALALRELHNHVFPDISFEQSPLKQAA